MAEIKTKPTSASVVDFLNNVPDEQKRKDSFLLLDLFKNITGDEPKMWGDSMVGFIDFQYKYKTGTSGTWFKTGFSPRKQNLTIYLSMYGFEEHSDLLNKLGKHKTGKGCLYINKLADVDIEVLKELIIRTISK
ncbi:MAG: DUF1801 domain-containing protein [Bacteroidales bacterium]